VRLFAESYLSDSDNFALLENTIPINLMKLLCVLLFRLFFILINGTFHPVIATESGLQLNDIRVI